MPVSLCQNFSQERIACSASPSWQRLGRRMVSCCSITFFFLFFFSIGNALSLTNHTLLPKRRISYTYHVKLMMVLQKWLRIVSLKITVICFSAPHWNYFQVIHSIFNIHSVQDGKPTCDFYVTPCSDASCQPELCPGPSSAVPGCFTSRGIFQNRSNGAKPSNPSESGSLPLLVKFISVLRPFCAKTSRWTEALSINLFIYSTNHLANFCISSGTQRGWLCKTQNTPFPAGFTNVETIQHL